MTMGINVRRVIALAQGRSRMISAIGGLYLLYIATNQRPGALVKSRFSRKRFNVRTCFSQGVPYAAVAIKQPGGGGLGAGRGAGS